MTDIARSAKSVELPPARTESTDFPSYEPVTASPEFAEFLHSLRLLQDLASSSNPDDATWSTAAAHLNAANAHLEPHQASEGVSPAGRTLDQPGMGNPLLPAWRITAAGPEGTTLQGQFSRYYLGANNIVLGGVLPLLFDWTFAIAVTAAGRPLSRTGYLNVDYRKPTPINTDLTVTAHAITTDGRKSTLTAELTDASGTVLARAETLMITLLAHHR